MKRKGENNEKRYFDINKSPHPLIARALIARTLFTIRKPGKHQNDIDVTNQFSRDTNKKILKMILPVQYLSTICVITHTVFSMRCDVFFRFFVLCLLTFCDTELLRLKKLRTMLQFHEG